MPCRVSRLPRYEAAKNANNQKMIRLASRKKQIKSLTKRQALDPKIEVSDPKNDPLDPKVGEIVV